jgi:hypothetical protein
MKKFALLAAVALYAAPASATVIAPGTPGPGLPPTTFNPATQGTLLASSTTTGQALTFAATFYSAVYTSTLGGLDFYYQVARTGAGSNGGNEPIASFTVSPFGSFLVDAQLSTTAGFGPFLTPTNLPDVSGVSRSLSGDVVTVNFGLNPLNDSEISPIYVLHTNATAFTNGTFGILDGSAMQGPTFAPTVALPEPGTWMTLLAGFGMLGLALRFRRRKTALA